MGCLERLKMKRPEDGPRTHQRTQAAAGFWDHNPDGCGELVQTRHYERFELPAADLEEIRKQAQESEPLSLIYKERDLAIRVVRDYFNPSIKAILVDDKEVYQRVKDFLQIISPVHKHIVKLYKDKGPIFSKYNLENQIEQLFHKKVPLKSGGYLVIDPTEALVAIDVNSGRAAKEAEQEENIFR